MLKFNSFRSDRYLRSKFVEGRYFLASEGTDLELELLDSLRKVVKETIGDVAVEDAWQVERQSVTQLLIKPGSAWFKGLPFLMRSGTDHLVSGASLTLGTVPTGVSVTDDSSGQGKILTFTPGSTPTNLYKIVISAQEEIITDVEDQFLKNVNITESTAQKIRLNFRINIVPASLQTETPSPYRDENSVSGSATNFPNTGGFNSPNLVNQIAISPANGSAEGAKLLITNLSGSSQIDGRDIEITIKNTSGSNLIPNGSSAQQAFYNGKLIDTNGAEYHINAIFNDVVADQVIVRVDKEVGQPNPTFANDGSTYYLVKRDVYYTDDNNGTPLGKLYWPIANADWNTSSGFVHSSSIADLRERILSEESFEDAINAKLILKLSGGGVIGVASDGETLHWDADFSLINPGSSSQTIQGSGTANNGELVLVDGGSASYEIDFAGGVISKGNLPVTISSVAGPDVNLSGSPDLSLVKVGNVIKVKNEQTFVPGDVNTGTDVITITGHSFSDDESVIVYTDDTLPRGLSAGKVYYIVNSGINDFQLSLTVGGAAVDLLSVGVGTQTIVHSETSVITAISDISGSEQLEVSPNITMTGSAIIYRDSFGPATVSLDEKTFTLAVRSGIVVTVNDVLNLSGGESNAIYDERLQFASGLAANTRINLPNNSINDDRPQLYSSTKRNLEVYVNQLLKFQGIDWLALDSNTIQFTYALPTNTEVHFRIDSQPSGSVGGGSSGGGAGTLQEAYDGGNTIAVSGGLPFTVSGTGKVAVFNGDITVTGVIDPTGLELTPVASNPLDVGQKGIWVSTTNELMFEGSSTSNISERLDDLESGASNPITGGDGLTKSGNDLSVNVDNSTIEINTDALRVKDLGITTAKLANASVDENKISTSIHDDSLSGGAGTPLSVNYSQATKLDVIVGESFAANTSFLVRWAVSGETAGRIYKADPNVATDDKYKAIGLLLSTSALSAGNSAQILTYGLSDLGLSDTPFGVGDIGKAIYLGSNGSYTLTPSTTVGAAQYKIGAVAETSKIWLSEKELLLVVPAAIYDEEISYPAGLVAATPITLPGGKTYSPTSDELKVYVNQLIKTLGVDYTSPSNTEVQFAYDLPNDAIVRFRIERAGAGILTAGGGGGGGSLQDAYDAGNTVTVNTGVPITINGTSGKLLVINGDIEVTGVIDPSGIELTPQSSNPLGGGAKGLWINTSDELVYQSSSQLNITQKFDDIDAGLGISVISKLYTNTSLSTLDAFKAVYTNTVGGVQYADGTHISKFRVIGVSLESIAASADGVIAITGVVPGIMGLTHNNYAYLGLTPGSIVDVEPTIGGGYPSGFNIIKLGIIEGTNLILQIEHMGVL